MPTIGDKIRVMRKSRGWDQQDLAIKVGVKRNAVSMWENSRRIPSYELREVLADVFNVPLSYLYDDKQSQATVSGTPPDSSYIKVADDDTKRLEALHQNPRLGLLFDRISNMSEDDIIFMEQFADRIMKERDH